MDKIYLKRDLEDRLLMLSSYFSATVLVGSRQVGKTSLVQALRNQMAQQSVYFDLERPEDLAALGNLEALTDQYLDHLLIFDEVQRRPDLFPQLRSIIDRHRKPGRFLLLGSASFDLIRDASETLAGRIAIEELTGLLISEVAQTTKVTTHWLRGGFPDSLLAPSDELSLLWRDNLLRTYIERDLPAFGLPNKPNLMRRLLTMIGHVSGQLLNVNQMSKSLQLNHRTLTGYLELLEQTFVIRRLAAYHVNLGKRLVKTPKLYIRDTGILHTLLSINNYVALSRHPVFGASFESFVIEQIAALARRERVELSYYRTTNGAEVDLVLERGGQVIGLVEIKASEAPKLTKGFYKVREDFGYPPTFIVCLANVEPYSLGDGILVLGVKDVSRVL